MDTLDVVDDSGTILIVDDDPSNIDILSEVLEDNYDILFATSGPDAIKIVKEEKPDLIILDVVMPNMDGYTVCSTLKADPSVADIPVIFVTALSNVADEAKGLEMGAVDYITKPISPPVVTMRVSNHIKLTKALIKLEKLSTTDALTELANRRHMDNRLARECSALRKSTDTLSVILLDIDFFKIFNDTYGHQEGDDCLQKVAQAITNSVTRQMDMTARYGGEEFCCILPATNYKDSLKVAENIRKHIEALNISHKNSEVSQIVTASLGVVTFNPKKGCTPAQVLKTADENLYAAKKAGRNRIIGTDYA